MKIKQISVGLPGNFRFDGRNVTTSIFKSPVDGKVEAGYHNLAGDRQSDLKVHGGRDKAMYAYSQDYYPAWADDLGLAELEPAQFGENLAVTGGMDSDVVIGASYAVGSAEVTVTQPRIPCFKLGIRLNNIEFPRLFWEKGRLGFYLRVEKEGALQNGDIFKLIHKPGHGISVQDLWAAVVHRDAAVASQALEQLQYLDGGWIRRLEVITRAAEHGNQ